MPVQTFLMGTVNSLESTYSKLDARVNEAAQEGKWEIISIQDFNPPYTQGVQVVARSVLYRVGGK